MSLYDCFTYNNEDLLLDIRLNYLNDKVKKFVIAESRYTHQGRRKKTLFDINNFSKFKHKIIYLLIENFPPSFSNWERENYQRNYLTNAFSHIQDDDHIMISDLDEIPNLENLHNFINSKFVVFEQNNYSYKLNLFSISIGFFTFVKCHPPSLINFILLNFLSLKKISNLNLEYFFALTFLNHCGLTKFFFKQPLVPCHINFGSAKLNL